MNIQEWLEAGKPWNVILHGDCMDLMKHFKDKEINLSIVDPPYGIHDKITNNGSMTKSKGNKFAMLYDKKQWDKSRPDKNYFNELIRISQNQIICGANYFVQFLKPSRGWIVWDKQGEGMSSVNNELIFTSFDISIKTFSRCHGLDKGFMIRDGFGSIHPTQKPIALYRWLLQNYAKPGDKIIDTHSGSGSLACACHLEKFDFLAIEKDEDYHTASVKRLEELRSQGVLF
jgi:site-specific DNA-methyltransferase (adenine-specific)